MSAQDRLSLRSHCARLTLCLASFCIGCDRDSPQRNAVTDERAVSAPAPAAPMPLVPAASASSTAPLRIVLIADLQGALEPCGCTSRPLGGVDRLAAAVATLRRDARNVLVLAAGDLFSASSRRVATEARVQDVWQADAMAAVLGRLGIDVIAPGAADLAHAPERVATLARQGRAILLGSGSRASALDALVSSARVHAGEIELGVVAVASTDAKTLAAAAQRVGALRSDGSRLAIAFVQGSAAAARRVAVAVGADLVVHSGDPDQPAAATAAPNGALLMSAGRHAEQVLAVDVWPGAGPAHQARAGVAHVRDLDRDAAPDPAVRELLDQVFARVNAHNAGAYAKVASPPARAGEPSYVGSRTCAACHTQAYFWWQQTPHARAFDTLIARHRQLDLDCIGCHVTGYQQPGGSSVGRLDELKGVGCESCHGPGSAHVENPQRPGRAIQRAVPERACIACHDPEHSDKFRYAEAREQLSARGHAAAP